MIRTCALALALLAPPSQEVRLPMDGSSGDALVQVSLEGHGPYRFHLDTGASTAVCVDRQLAAELELPIVGSAVNSDGREQASRDVVLVDELSIGAHRWRELRALVDDYSWVAREGEEPLMGLLGYPFVERGLLTIDYGRQELVLAPGALDPGGQHVVACRRESRPVVELALGAQRFQVLLDTGARAGLVLPEEAFGRVELRGPVTERRLRSVYGTAPVREALLARPLELAGHRIEGVRVSFAELDQGLLGQDVLTRFVLTFDPGSGLARFALPETPADEDPDGERATLEVLALANEGFLLRAGDDLVLIDAFVTEPYAGYGALEGEAREALLTGTGPFAGADLALASHVHRDHFQPEPARRFLAAAPDCRLVSSPQVVAALRGEGEEFAQARALLPDPGAVERLELGGVRVELLRLSHGTGRFAGIQNLGHVITVGGVTALHVGDAAMVPETFAAYELGARGIDLVFVPYWYFDDPVGRRIVDEHLRPAKLVACHVPPPELATLTRRLAETWPDVRVPRAALERFTVRDQVR